MITLLQLCRLENIYIYFFFPHVFLVSSHCLEALTSFLDVSWETLRAKVNYYC